MSEMQVSPLDVHAGATDALGGRDDLGASLMIESVDSNWNWRERNKNSTLATYGSIVLAVVLALATVFLTHTAHTQGAQITALQQQLQKLQLQGVDQNFLGRAELEDALKNYVNSTNLEVALKPLASTASLDETKRNNADMFAQMRSLYNTTAGQLATKADSKALVNLR